MIDLKAARQEPDRYRAALARRGAAEDFDALLDADARWREATERSESLRAEQKRSSKGGPPGPDQLAALQRLAGELTEAQAELAHADHERQALLDKIPNLPDPTAADGMTEEDAQTLRTWGERPSFAFTPRDATDLGSPRGWIDMARGARLSGSRFAYRFGDVALAGPTSAMSWKNRTNARAVQSTPSPASEASTAAEGVRDGQVSAAGTAYTSAVAARQTAVMPRPGRSPSLLLAISGPVA